MGKRQGGVRIWQQSDYSIVLSTHGFVMCIDAIASCP